MKRFIVHIILGLMLMLSVNVLAKDEPVVKLKTQKQKEYYAVYAFIENNPGICSVELTVSFGENASPVSAQKEELFENGIFITSLDDERYSADSGKIQVVYINTADVTEDGRMFCILFKAKGSKAPEVSISQEDMQFINMELQAVDVTVSDEKQDSSSGNTSGPSHVTVEKAPSSTDEDEDGEPKAEDDKKKLSFTDVTEKDWYFGAVDYVVEKGLMNGVGEGLFAPKSTMTRAMVVTVLWRMEDCPKHEKSTFCDIEENSWYEAAVNWAYSFGIVNGMSDSEFAPGDNITREQLSTIIYRYLVYEKYPIENPLAASYTDRDEISPYAAEAVDVCNSLQLMIGRDDGRFDPKASVTRAESATVLMRITELFDALITD